MEKIKIMVCTHKKWDIPNDDIYMPLHVGKALSELDFGYLGDNTGDNISRKNKYYCELTGLYWGWKNMDVEYLGLCHYRRYLDFGKKSPIDCLGHHDIIMPKLNSLNMSSANMLMNLTTREDFHIMLMAILKLYPDYKDTLLRCFYMENRCSLFNMLFCRKTIYDEYCRWLFSIFDEMEKWVKLSDYSRLHRLFGFLSEYLLYVYCVKNKLNILYLPTISHPYHNKKLIGQNQLPRMISMIVKDVGFFFSHKKISKFPINPTNTTGFINDKIPYIDENGNVINYPNDKL